MRRILNKMLFSFSSLSFPLVLTLSLSFDNLTFCFPRLFIYLSVCISIYLPTYLSILPIYLPEMILKKTFIHISIYLSTYLRNYLSYLSISRTLWRHCSCTSGYRSQALSTCSNWSRFWDSTPYPRRYYTHHYITTGTKKSCIPIRAHMNCIYNSI